MTGLHNLRGLAPVPTRRDSPGAQTPSVRSGTVETASRSPSPQTSPDASPERRSISPQRTHAAELLMTLARPMPAASNTTAADVGRRFALPQASGESSSLKRANAAPSSISAGKRPRIDTPPEEAAGGSGAAVPPAGIDPWRPVVAPNGKASLLLAFAVMREQDGQAARGERVSATEAIVSRWASEQEGRKPTAAVVRATARHIDETRAGRAAHAGSTNRDILLQSAKNTAMRDIDLLAITREMAERRARGEPASLHDVCRDFGISGARLRIYVDRMPESGAPAPAVPMTVATRPLREIPQDVRLHVVSNVTVDQAYQTRHALHHGLMNKLRSAETASVDALRRQLAEGRGRDELSLPATARTESRERLVDKAAWLESDDHKKDLAAVATHDFMKSGAMDDRSAQALRALIDGRRRHAMPDSLHSVLKEAGVPSTARVRFAIAQRLGLHQSAGTPSRQRGQSATIASTSGRPAR